MDLKSEVKRRDDDGRLAQCPLCASLDIGGASSTVSCYCCGLQITKEGPLENAIFAWNMRGGVSLDIDIKAPLPELEGTHPVVMYFGNDADREEFIEVVASMPNMRAEKL